MESSWAATKSMCVSCEVDKRSQELTRDILPVTKVGDDTIRAKSGLLGVEQGKDAYRLLHEYQRRVRPPNAAS